MNRLITFAAAMLFASTASATCVGSGSLQTCSDNSGNTYTVNRLGSTTYLNGNNSRTGSTWNQTSQTIGSTTFHNGTSSDGNSWNSTQQRIGNSTFINGTDSKGNTFNKVCNQYGCN